MPSPTRRIIFPLSRRISDSRAKGTGRVGRLPPPFFLSKNKEAYTGEKDEEDGTA